VGDRDDLIAQTKGEQHLGGRRDQAHDVHQVYLGSRNGKLCETIVSNGEGSIRGGTNDMTELLSDSDIAQRLDGSQWAREDDEIVREWKFDDFAAAMAFVNQVAEVAEEANHHPDILLHGWNKVRLSLTNHSAGGLTEADFEIAARLDGLH
jgi:4a-hydroxytetrahydrobiopterin dehydratase